MAILEAGSASFLPHSSQSQSKSQGQPSSKGRTKRLHLLIGGVAIINLSQNAICSPALAGASTPLNIDFPLVLQLVSPTGSV